MRIWTPSDSARAQASQGLLKRSTKLGGWFFRRRRQRDDGSYEEQDEQINIWDGSDVTSCPIVPREERKTQPSIRSLEWQDIDQGQTSACAVASFCNAMQFLMAKLGRKQTPLDWYKAYVALSGGRGGVEIGVVLSYAMSHGIPLVDGSGVVVVTEAWDAASREAIVSGLQRGGVATFGHDVHAECATTEVVGDDGDEYMDVRNSWGRGWGDQGYHVFPLSEVEMGYGAAIIRDVQLRPIDVAGLPDAS